MNQTNKIFSLILLLFVLAVNTSTAFANPVAPPPPINEDKVVIGQTFILKEDQVLNGDLAVIGGTVFLRQGSLVSGNVAIIGGLLQVDGTIEGDIQALGGSIELLDKAIVEGSLYNYSSTLTQAEGAQIEGSQIANLPFEFNFGELAIPSTPGSPTRPNINIQPATNFIGNFLWAILQILAIAALAMLIVLLAPKSTERVAATIGSQPFVNWGIGLLSAFAVPAVLVILIVTLILSPLGLIGFLVLACATIYGWIALGFEIGKRLIGQKQRDFSPALLAGIGTLIITIIARLSAEVPCVGWIVGSALSLFGLGAVVLTRFGTRDYPYTYSGVQPPTPSPLYTNILPETASPLPRKGPSLADILADEENFDDDLLDEELDDNNPSRTNPEKED
jgi:hypothetical protein